MQNVFFYVNLTTQVLFKIRFKKCGLTYKKHVVNPRHKHSNGNQMQSLEHSLEYLSCEYKYDL